MTFRTFIRLAAQTQLLPVLESGEETLVGGQAVMEGVMMRAPHSYCVAVRRANGELVTEESPLPRVSEKYPIFKYPILRGVGTLGQAMWLGVKSLNFSTRNCVDTQQRRARKSVVWVTNQARRVRRRIRKAARPIPANTAEAGSGTAFAVPFTVKTNTSSVRIGCQVAPASKDRERP